jgi:hypothetical protein
MNNLMPCITDSDEFRFEPDGPEDESPLTDMEKRIEWICDDWADALEIDTYDEWNSVRMSIHGAIQTLIYCPGRAQDESAMRDLRAVAFENGMDCIKRGKFEGA